MHSFELNFLDHVAIRVKDLERSAQWYNQVLGLTIVKKKEWTPFPIMMIKGRTGIALFPANLKDPSVPESKNIKIDHFAFNVDPEEYAKAIQHFRNIGLDYEEQDHYYFKSVYISDPDGHTVELTSLNSQYSDFYK